MYWVLCHILSDPELYKAVMKEVEQINLYNEGQVHCEIGPTRDRNMMLGHNIRQVQACIQGGWVQGVHVIIVYPFNDNHAHNLGSEHAVEV